MSLKQAFKDSLANISDDPNVINNRSDVTKLLERYDVLDVDKY